MGVFTQLVRSNGTELTFIKKLIHTVLAADSRITCNQTDAEIEEMFTNPPEGFLPEFTFNVGDMYTIRFRRFHEASAAVTAGYNAWMKSTANAGEVGIGINYSSQGTSITDAYNRQIWLKVVSSEKAILIIFGNHDQAFLDGTYCLRCIGYKDGDIIGFSAQKNESGTSEMGAFFYIGDTCVTPTEQSYFKNDPSDNRKIVIGKNKIMRTSDNYKHSVTDALCDCSIVSFLRKEIKIGDKHYFVATQTELMPL